MPSDAAATRLTYSAVDPRLDHVVGLVEGGTIRLDGTAEGCALFGPYANLAAGQWRAELRLAAQPKPGGHAVMDVVAEGGNQSLARIEIEAGTLDAAAPQIVLDFALDRDLAGIELRFFVYRGFEGALQQLSFSPVALVAPARTASSAGTQPSRARTSYGVWRDVMIGGQACRMMGDPEDGYFANLDTTVQEVAPLLRIARAALPADGVVVDAGANIGLTARALAPLVPRGRVHAFEPVPRAVRFLGANALAEPLGNIEVVPLALGAQAGRIAMQTAGGSSSHSHVVDAAAAASHAGVEMVEATTLDSWSARKGLQRLDLLKIDVEGFELDVLAGAAATIARLRPMVVLEVNSFALLALRNRNPREAIEDLIERFPFVFSLDTAGGAPVRITRGDALTRFIHDHLVRRPAIDDLVCCFEDSWLARLGTGG